MLGSQNNTDNTDQPTSQFDLSTLVMFPRKLSRLIAYTL